MAAQVLCRGTYHYRSVLLPVRVGQTPSALPRGLKAYKQINVLLGVTFNVIILQEKPVEQLILNKPMLLYISIG